MQCKNIIMHWIYTNLLYSNLDIDMFKVKNNFTPKIVTDEMELYYDVSRRRYFGITCINSVCYVTNLSYLGLKNGDIVPPEFNHINS